MKVSAPLSSNLVSLVKATSSVMEILSASKELVLWRDKLEKLVKEQTSALRVLYVLIHALSLVKQTINALKIHSARLDSLASISHVLQPKISRQMSRLARLRA